MTHDRILDIAQPCRAQPCAASPSWRDRLQFLLVKLHNCILRPACLTYESFIWYFSRLSPAFLAWESRIRARLAFHRAARNVPAYAQFIGASATPDAAPETDKDSYIRTFRPEARCVGGRFPQTAVAIDESSGSTGTPYNWVRSRTERHQSHVLISYFTRYLFGTAQRITINAFSMGAWATGINMGVALERNGIVKNTGPDIDKILDTLRFFGPGYEYLLTGYPPFLKHLLDVAEARQFPLESFRLNALVGGEGMAEGLRDYLLRHFQKVYSGYGATDLEIGVAGETSVAVAIRRLARDDPTLRRALFGDDSRLPMVFQYIPLMHHIEVNAHGELLVTITRPDVLSPRIRYNVHDQGGVATYDQLARTLAGAGYDLELLGTERGRNRLRLPFLWVFGRRDYTVSVMGANIYPEDLEQCLYAEPELAKITRSFCLSTAESADGSVRPRFLFEIEPHPTDDLASRFAVSMTEGLRRLNADFREAWKEYPETMTPEVSLYGVGEGPFAADPGKIKQVRLLRRD